MLRCSLVASVVKLQVALAIDRVRATRARSPARGVIGVRRFFDCSDANRETDELVLLSGYICGLPRTRLSSRREDGGNESLVLSLLYCVIKKQLCK